MLCSVALAGTGNWGTCPSGVCECTQILQPFKLWLCLSFCPVSSKLDRQSHQSPENNFYLIFALRKYRYHRYIGIADISGQIIGIALLSKSQYRARALWRKILATPLVVLKHSNIGFEIMDCCLIQANLPLFILAHMVD